MTVLFADVVGFTSLSERRDPEQVKHLVDRCFQWLTAEIVSYGGRVDKIIGDAVLALFGAPVAHEDDAERAVRAALRMQRLIAERSDELEGTIRLRIGVNTGEVLVGALSAGGDYTAMGDVVNTASRLQTAAQPGEVLVGVSTHAATSRVIPYEDRGVVPAKGKEEPVVAWAACEPATAPGDRPNRNSGPLVGRDAEVGALRSVASIAMANDRASILVLLGDAGMGKSRVAAEVTAGLEVDQRALVLHGRCLPYGEVNAWWPIADVIRGALDVDFGDPVNEIIPMLDTLINDVAQGRRNDADIARMVAGLTSLFGFVDETEQRDPQRLNEDIFRSVVGLLDDLTSRRPVVLWIADLQWADPVVSALIERVLGALERRPLVVMVTARRSMLSRWSPPVGRFDTFALNLEALGDQSIDQLIDLMATENGQGILSPETKALLRDRSGGNPLFLVELLSLLNEQERAGDATLDSLHALPDTLRGLIAARLDNLGTVERALIDDASVLGRRGKITHLSEMVRVVNGIDDTRKPLAALVSRDLFRSDGDTWEFTSDLTREVAYGMLTKSDRAKRHLGIAQWIEKYRDADVNDSIADVLAHHYGQAVELLADLGTLHRLPPISRAHGLSWLDRVSERDARMRLFPNVEHICTQAILLTQGDDSAELTFLLRRARARAQARDASGAARDVSRVRELGERTDDHRALAAVLVIEGELAQQRGDLVIAADLFTNAVTRFGELGDDEGRGDALRSLGMAELFAGRMVDAERASTAALEVFRSVGRRSGEAWALQSLAWIAFAQADLTEAEARIAESLALFGESGEDGGLAWARGLRGFIRLGEGDLVGAEELQASVLEDALASGDRWASAMMRLLASIICIWTGRTEEGLHAAAQGMELFRAVHDRFGQVQIVWPYGRALAMRGRIRDARGELDRVSAAGTASHMQLGQMNDALLLTVARATIEMHVGNPEPVLETLVSLTSDFGMESAADFLSGEHRVKNDMDWIGAALRAGAGFDLLTVIATSLAQVGRVNDAKSLLDAAVQIIGGDRLTAPVHACFALVDAALGLASDVASHASRVRGDDRATYLDRSLAETALGLSDARYGDTQASARAFQSALAAVDATGDVLSQTLVRLAHARSLERLGETHSDVSLASLLARLTDMGTDAHGWLVLFDECLGDDI